VVWRLACVSFKDRESDTSNIVDRERLIQLGSGGTSGYFAYLLTITEPLLAGDAHARSSIVNVCSRISRRRPNSLSICVKCCVVMLADFVNLKEVWRLVDQSQQKFSMVKRETDRHGAVAKQFPAVISRQRSMRESSEDAPALRWPACNPSFSPVLYHPEPF